MASGDPVPGVGVLDRGDALGEDDSAAGTSSRTSRLLPGIHVLRHYRRAWLRGDVVAGCTVAAYLVPQVMAYAEVAGLPPVTGLWAVMGPLVVYAVLGSSRQLSVGPESTTALMTATALAALTAGGALPGEAAAALAIAVGAVCLVGWLARLGFLANLLSHPILTGYMAGIAVLMIISQLDNFTGIPIPSGDTFTEIAYFLRHLDQVHLLTFGLADPGARAVDRVAAVGPGCAGSARGCCRVDSRCGVVRPAEGWCRGGGRDPCGAASAVAARFRGD